MLKNIRTSLLVAFFGLIFVGQTVASSMMFYSMFNMDMANMSMADMNMPSHDMAMMSHHDTQDANNLLDSTDSMTTSMQDNKNCCVKECQCLASACSTVFSLSNVMNTSPILGASIKISSVNRSLASQILTSLYKPPRLS